MRQAGILEKETEAHQFADYLVTQGISAHAEFETSGWTVWVRDEDQIEQAKDELENFKRMPDDARYAGVSSKAQSIRQAEVQRRERVHRYTVEMRTQWKPGVGSARRCPAVFFMIGVTFVVALLTSFSFDPQNKYFAMLQFRDPARPVAAGSDALVDIRRGEVWRLVTPVFVHGDAIHFLFNMYWLFFLGGQYEHIRGTWRFLLFFFSAAVISILALGLVDTGIGGGMSGVNYALFGYVWMRSHYAPQEGFQLSRFTVILMVVWFFLCFVMPDIANGAHASGFAYGLILGYIPQLFKTR